MNTALHPGAPATSWRTALAALLAAWGLLALLYADTLTGMVAIWLRSDTFAHALLVPPISAWLVWRQRQALAALAPRPQPWLLVALLPLAGFWLIGHLVLVNAATQFAWVAMFVLLVPVVLGVQVTQVILFPLLFLFFAVPFGEFMMDPMMRWTADFTVAAIRLTGIPVYREGLHFVIPSGHWSVVEACSGVRYLIASFMVGTLFAYLNYRSWQRRVLFMAVSIAVPIFANWVRAYGIVMLGHFSGNTVAVGVDHLVYGWVFFGIVVLVMFLIGARWAEPEAGGAAAAPLGVAGAATAAAAPQAARLGRVAAAALAVLLLPHAGLLLLERHERGFGTPVLALPAAMGAEWQAVPPVVDFEPAFQPPAALATATYGRGAQRVGVHLGYYRGQSADSKLVTSVNTLARSEDPFWSQVGSGSAAGSGDGAAISWRTAVLRGTPGAGAGPGLSGAQRTELLVWRVYWIDGRWVASDARAKLAGALARLRGRGDDGAVLILWTPARPGEAPEATLRAFLPAALPAITSALRAAQARE